MPDIHANDAADRLDALWDDLVQTGSADLSSATDGDAARLSLISYVSLLVPRSEPAARERVRHWVFAGYTEDAMRTASNVRTASAFAGSAQMPLPRPWVSSPVPRRWWRRSLGVMELAATLGLILAIIGGIAFFRPDNAPTSLPAAGSPDLRLGSATAPDGEVSSEDLLNLELAGRPNRSYWISLLRVTMQPSARWSPIGDPIAEGTDRFDYYVEAGTLTVGTHTGDYVVLPGDDREIPSTPIYLHNDGQAPTTFLMMFATAGTPPNFESLLGMEIQHLGAAPIPPIAGDPETTVRLTRSTLQADGGTTLPVAPKTSTVFVAVESGTLLANTTPDARIRTGQFGPGVLGARELPDFSPAPANGIEVGPGETLTLDRTFAITDSVVVGDEPVRVLSLSFTVVDNARPAETAQPNEVVWSIPSDGDRISLRMYKIALASDGTLNQPVDGAAIIRIIEGKVAVTQNADDEPHQLEPDDSFALAGPGSLGVETIGDGPAVLIVGLVLPIGDENPFHALGLESNFVLTPLGVSEVELPPGDARLQLWTETLSPDPANSLVAFQANGANLVSVLAGSADVVRYGGQVRVFDGPFTVDDDPASEGQEYPFGVKVTASSGDAIVAQPRSAYSLSTHGDEVPLVATLSIDSVTPIDMTTPGPRGDEPITFHGDVCQVEPRAADDLRRLVENPADTEVDTGLRDDAAEGEAADATTAAEITAAIREALACSTFGTPVQSYALFTENALRSGAVANGLTLAEIDEMERATPDEFPQDFIGTFAIDEISVFPDGRAGAWIFNSGELAYLTLVFDPEAGRWLIDAWDDRERSE